VTSAQQLLAALAGHADAVTDERSGRLLADFPPGNPWRRFVLSHLLRLAWYAGDDKAWEHWYRLLHTAPPVGEWPVVAAAARLADGQQALREDDVSTATSALEEAAGLLRACDANGLLDTAELLHAWCLLRQGRREDASRALLACLQRAIDESRCVGLLLAGRRALGALEALVPAAGPLRHAWKRTHVKVDPTVPQARPSTLDGVPMLSARERDVLTYVAAGDSNKMIARTLAVSPHTIKRHIANILNKLGVSTRAQAAVWFSAQVQERGPRTA
jgi:LuxR family maltose regulon positive regulatory protein